MPELGEDTSTTRPPAFTGWQNLLRFPRELRLIIWKEAIYNQSSHLPIASRTLEQHKTIPGLSQSLRSGIWCSKSV
jgi:hypothetical protein